ncbi:hypothetical protein AAFP35_25575 [Gordonia sp. CPCC 206044]|uniref:hypothetical protein n=1 Tax=Gordonia sp. CPCC 206044 TaxID=3140793 RepID=UPI003AF334A3
MNTKSPRQVVADLQAHPELATGSDERFAGYGVMGMPFATGHYLALRDMVASSIGPSFRSVWHRDPEGQWTFHTTIDPERSCPRYFGSDGAVKRVGQITLDWADDWTLEVGVDDALRWRIELGASPATRMMTSMGAALPSGAWNSTAVLGSMGPMARAVLRSGRIRLCGETPNGPRYRAAPLHVWRVTNSRAHDRTETFGAPAPLDVPIRLGDFWLPQRGLFFVGRARFTQADAVAGREPTERAAVRG